MQFKAIQDAVLAPTAFDESRRSDVKNWINARYWMLWNHAEWSFAENTVAVTVTAGSYNVTALPADMLIARALQCDDGTPLTPIYQLQDFEALYVGTSATASGTPEAYTVLSPTLVQVGPKSAVTSSTYQLTYRQEFTALVNDSDVPAIPSGCHLALVHGAKAEGYVLDSILLSDPFEARWTEYLQSMVAMYTSSMDAPGRQSPAYGRQTPAYSGW